MRNLVWIWLLCLTACQQVTVPGHGGGGIVPKASSMNYGEVGNGGHGIKLGDKIYLYDLWEAGIEKGPKYPFSAGSLGALTPHQVIGNIKVGAMTSTEHTVVFFRDQLIRVLPNEKDLVASLADRLAVIFELDPVLAMSLYEAIQAHTWNFTDVELNDLRLPDPVHKLNEGEQVLLANRSGRFIYVFNKFWAMMDLWNRTGLILHEAIYSLLPPQTVMLASGRETLRQDGKRARQILGILSGVRSFNSLYEMGLVSVIERTELPLLADTRVPFFKVTSTFFTRAGRFQKILVPKNRLALVGPARYHLIIKDPDITVDVPIMAFEIPDMDGRQKKETEALLKAPCEALSTKNGLEYQIDIVFPVDKDNQEQSFELKVAHYQENDEMKQYIHFTPLTETKSQPAVSGSSKIFFDIASTEGRTIEQIVFGKAQATQEEVVKSCVRYLSGTLSLHPFYFPAKYPLDPANRYGG